MKLTRMNIRIATPEEVQRYETFDYTKLTAINMCPTWGIVRYGYHKVMPGGGRRSTALEAGTVMHECFSVVRLLQVAHAQQLPQHAEHTGVRQFGQERWQAIAAAARQGADGLGILRTGALEALATSGYVDDPYDRYRTMVNLENSLLYYVQQWDWHRYPVWIADPADPTAPIGVEIPFALLVEMEVDGQPAEPFIYTGRVDGLHVNARRDGELLVQENKTAARLSESWASSFDMSHQVTGYTIAASLIAEHPVTRGLVLGISIPLPRDTAQGFMTLTVTRREHMRSMWCDWVAHTVMLYRQHREKPLDAPKYTHSCNRYFSTCPLIPLCTGDDDERHATFDAMEASEWSPLAERVDTDK